MRRLKKQLVAILMAAAMMSSLVPNGGALLQPEMVLAAETGTVVYESDAAVSEELDFSAKSEEDWASKETVTYAYTNDTERKLEANYTVHAKVCMDETSYQTLAQEGNFIKLQGVVKLGADWTYTKGDSWPYLDKNAFALAEDGKYYADAEIAFEDKAGTLMEIDFEVVGVGFVGTISFSNVVVTTEAAQTPELAEVEPIVLSAVNDSEEVSTKWTGETGYKYTHGGSDDAAPVIDFDENNGDGRLRVTLDYSANATEGWSEAKVTYTVSDSGVDISNYNQISVDLIYPADVNTNITKFKYFAQDADGTALINKDGGIDFTEAVDAGEGWKKVTVTFAFSPKNASLKTVTLGLIGVNSSFQGDVYLDNLTLSQKSAKDDFVEITSVVGTATTADISKTPVTVKLADENADDSAKALFAYLQGLSESDQVLFGHQNDVSRSVNPAATLGDVADVTGSVSAMFGLDSLALTGSEAGGTDAASALEKSIAYSKLAANNGAIITLSTHMPNFTNDKIVKNEDGTYDFFNCDFNESKDLTNDCVKKILPGGEYNEVFNAYLDIVANYAKELQKEQIPVVFRPLHENTGAWFWWGSTNSVESYKSLFRYTRDYLEAQGVHNMLYVYSPNGPLTSEDEYLSRYPGDEYVDIVAFDYYDDYNSYPAVSDGSWFEHLDETCGVVSAFAQKHGKVAAISECGVRAMKKDGSDNEGLLVQGTPVAQEKTGTNWYLKVNEIAKKNNMPYYLVWANFSDTNFYVPYKYDDTYGHEMINEFIEFYNDESSVFGDGTNFYSNIEAISSKTSVTTYDNPQGYMVYPFDMDTVINPITLTAHVDNAANVKFVLTDTATDRTVTLDAAKDAKTGLYAAELTQNAMTELGKTNVAAIQLVADDVTLATLENLSIGKEKESAPANVIEDFDYYSGSNGLLDASYSSNSAAGCSSAFVLEENHKADGAYSGAFTYTLKTSGSEVWTGRIKSELTNNDFSKYNALQMWVKPDGNGQKLVVQLTDGSGEEFEAYLTDFVKGTEAKYVTIPFSAFVGKKGGTLDASNITKFAIWCNSNPAGTAVEVTSSIYFDSILAVEITDSQIAEADANGLIITDKAIGSGTQNGGNTSVGGSDSSGGAASSGSTSTPGAGFEEEKTDEVITHTTIRKDDGSVIEKFVITGTEADTVATVSVTTAADGNKTVKANVTCEGIAGKTGTKTVVSQKVKDTIVKVAETEDVAITQKTVNDKGKTVYTLRVNAKDLQAGEKLALVKCNTKTGEYTLVNSKTYTVAKDGNLKLTIKNKAVYELMNQTDAKKLTTQILKTVTLEKGAKTLKPGKNTKIVFGDELNLSNVSKITYTSSDKSVARVNKNGKVTAKKEGTAVIKVKVTLKNGTVKTLKFKVTVKN